MTLREKRMKAAAIAVSCCLQNEQEENANPKESGWSEMGKKMAMDSREFIQRKGRGFRFVK
ncbi:MAG TPA: hypothetical protein PLM34_12265 [Lentimicrobium sp.]|nr:hypothetical protein [Lentimicrobium sp.]